MNTKLAALALVAVIAVCVTAIYSLNQYSNSYFPSVTPVPTAPPVPSTPTDQNLTMTIAWGRFNTTYPTQLTIVTPQNLSGQTGNVILQVNVTTSRWVISSVYYKADWLGDYHRLYSMDNQPAQGDTKMSQAITLIANFTGVPSGNHTVEVIANYHDYSHTYGAVNFTVGT